MKRCREITQMIEREQEIPLTKKERRSVTFHLFLCRLCRNYKKDSNLLSALLCKMLPKKINPITIEEISIIKNRLKN